jgi:hypothetical protein
MNVSSRFIYRRRPKSYFSMNDPSGGFTADAQLQQLIAQLQRQQQQQPMPIGPEHKISRHKFTPDEDELLRTLVAQLGGSDWNAISVHFHNRTARQCRDRWRHYISPELLTGNWTEAEDQIRRARPEMVRHHTVISRPHRHRGQKSLYQPRGKEESRDAARSATRHVRD